jgi:hypothetical protein
MAYQNVIMAAMGRMRSAFTGPPPTAGITKLSVTSRIEHPIAA